METFEKCISMTNVNHIKSKEKLFRVCAESSADLQIISSMLQDSIVPIGDIKYMAPRKKFFMICQRFCWELAENLEDSSGILNRSSFVKSGELEIYQRCLCALVFDEINFVRTKGLNLSNRKQYLNFLAFNLENEYVDLLFSGDKTIRLETENFILRAEEIGKSWPTSARPEHRGN